MMSAENRAVSGEIVKIIHDDSNKQVEHKEAAEEDKGDEEHVGQVGSTRLVRVQQLSRGHVSSQ